MDWGYTNARIRGMKSRLLDHHALDTLILQPDLESLLGELENTPYRDDIVTARGKYSGLACVEHALRDNFTRTFRKILGFVRQEEAEQYITIFLRRWDVQNIKTILRGKNIHVTNEEILDCIVPAGALDEATLTELVRQPDVRAVVDLLATWRIPYAVPLTEGFAAFAKSGNLSELECSLDRYYYWDALDKVKVPSANHAMIREILATEIDVLNLRTILRMINDKVSPEDAAPFLIEGGRDFDAKKLDHLVRFPTSDEVITALGTTRYRFLGTSQEPGIRSQKLSVIERQLERFLVEQGVKLFREDPLSVASLIAYFWAKYNEITNIRIISRCKTADFPVEHLREELVYV
jgi:V/A-type H+/Na+-transporting ATPase subunit C